MKRPELRPYQTEGGVKVNAAIAAGHRRVLKVAPTGSGKTVEAADMIAKSVARGHRVLVIAHRREIITQTVGKLAAAGIDAGIIQAGIEPRPELPVQVASIQTLHGRAIRGSKMPMPPADRLVIDEAHHARADTYREVIDAYPNAIVLGLTATPCRQDGRGLGEVFQILVPGPQVAELVEQGFLVPSQVYAPSAPDLTGVQVTRGDYVESQLAARMNQTRLVGDIVEHWLRLAERRPTVCFATGVAHSLHIRDEFRRAGVVAEHLDGSTPIEERESILRGLATGEVELVSNCAVLTEGWDCPDIGALILARPTKSLGLYRQMVGRALRPAPGKTDALILDHAGATFVHGLPDDDIAWSLDEDRPAVNTSQEARHAAGFGAALVDCPKCHAVRARGEPCDVCGWEPVAKIPVVDVIDGDLEPVQRPRLIIPAYKTETERQRFYQQLLGIALQRSYAPGFAFFKYQERFTGEKPPWSWRSLPPLEPEPHVLAWVNARALAFAKSQRRGAV